MAIKITILTDPKLRIHHALIMPASVISIIGIGVVTGSVAMQWAGFIVLLLAFFALCGSFMGKNEGLTISQARECIDKIEARERKKQQDDATGRA